MNTQSQYYQNTVTQKSWELLRSLKKQFPFTLIGGWAVYLYTKALKSKDIDIIIDYDVFQQLKNTNALEKNERLHKYQIKKENIDIDIYLPHYSFLGLPVKLLQEFTDKKESFTILKKEALLVTKLFAFSQRKNSIKGQKDLIDIVSLLMTPDFDFTFFNTFLKNNKIMKYNQMTQSILVETKEINELNLNQHFFAKKKKVLLQNLLI